MTKHTPMDAGRRCKCGRKCTLRKCACCRACRRAHKAAFSRAAVCGPPSEARGCSLKGSGPFGPRRRRTARGSGGARARVVPSRFSVTCQRRSYPRRPVGQRGRGRDGEEEALAAAGLYLSPEKKRCGLWFCAALWGRFRAGLLHSLHPHGKNGP